MSSSTSSSGSLMQALLKDPFPAYPFEAGTILAHIFPPWFYRFSLSPAVPIAFSLGYYILVHLFDESPSASASASASSSSSRRSKVDLTSGSTLQARSLRFIISSHNLLLAVYSAWTSINMFPQIATYFTQGYTIAGTQGLKFALCTMPTNFPPLGKYTYLFYLSKYYEVLDSVILLLKAKPVSQLQSYHHAGAILAMWIATRYQSQPVWVFCLFNSFVHTLMYSYYFSTSLKLPFPRAIKRNLTTIQILQIASGTFITNLYLWIAVNPQAILQGFESMSQSNSKTSTLQPSTNNTLWSVAKQRSLALQPSLCLQPKTAQIALHVNTAYMFPLLALFFNFFVRSYLRSPTSSTSNGSAQKPNRKAQ